MKNRIFLLMILLTGISLSSYAGDCIAVTSASSISCWGSAYVPFANDMRCWDINLNVSKPIKFTYTVDLERVNASDYLYIYNVDGEGNKKGTILSLCAISQNGTVTTTMPTGRARVELWSMSATKGGAMGIQCSFEAVNTGTIVDDDLIVVGKVGIGTSQPKSALHVNGAIRGGGSNGELKIENDMGYITMGVWNTAADIRTTADYFRFMQPVQSVAGIFSSGIESGNKHNLKFQTYKDSTRMTILQANGNVGIGTETPQEKLHIAGYVRGNGTNGALQIRTTKGITTIGAMSEQFSNFSTDRPMFYFNRGLILEDGKIGSYVGQCLRFSTNNTERMTIEYNGNIGIGTTAPEYKLDVNGTLRATKILVNISEGADFVFDATYPLRPLNEVKTFIQENGHLPEIQSAVDMQENGVSITDLQIQLLQKIEELTLYILKQDEQLQQLQEEVEELRK